MQGSCDEEEFWLDLPNLRTITNPLEDSETLKYPHHICMSSDPLRLLVI